MACEFDTTVLGGLPVTVEFEAVYEDGFEGHLGYYIDFAIIAVNGRTCKKPPEWVYNRLTSTDEDRIYEECAEYAGGW